MSAATSPTLRPLTFAWTSRKRNGLPVDRDRPVRDAHVGDLAQTDVIAARSVDEQVLDVRDRHASPGPLHDHLEDLLVLEDAADKEALNERGLSAAHVAGLDPGLSGLGDVDLDLHVRLLGGQPDDRVDDAVDLRHERPHLGRLGAEVVQVLAVHADDER